MAVGGRELSNYKVVRSRLFDDDAASLVKDPIQRARVLRRVKKLGDNPAHHGCHAGGLIRCNWVAGVGDWAIIYEVDKQGKTVRLLRLAELPV